MDMFLRGPAVPEERDRDEEREEETGCETHFGGVDAVVGLGQANDGGIRGLGYDDHSGQETKSYAEVGESAELGRPVVDIYEKASDGGED